MKKLFIAIFLLSITFFSQAQEVKSSSDVPYPFDVKFKIAGWTIVPGITYMLPAKNFEESFSNTAGDTSFANKATGDGGFGAYLEIGRFKAIKGARRIQYFDYTLAYKQFRGTENFEATITTPTGSVPLNDKSTYNENIVALNFNIYSVRKFKHNFLINSIGVAGNYTFLSSRETSSLVMATKTREFQNQIYAQLNYKIGLGFKPHKNFIVIPTIETPILTVYPFDGGLSSSKYFYTRHRPLIFGIRILWLKSNMHACPPVYI
jgi:hypothetical protein